MKQLIFLLLLMSANDSHATGELTIDSVYEKFNLRSINSSYGQRLKYFCQSYLKEFFPPKHIVAKTATELSLDNGDDVWTIKIIGKNKISVENLIKTGTYGSVSEYDIYFGTETSDWRAKEAVIEVQGKCVAYDPEKS